jgi:hypothetical protein
MLELDKKYKKSLDEIKDQVQSSEILAQYLEEEDEEIYKQLQDTFEPSIEELYTNIADHSPLQLEAFEKELLDPALEGLYLPRILGFSVLRGEVDDHIKFRKPQSHFREILQSICDSANFENLKKRIGQTVQVGFALSSDIWVTNFLDQVTNKRVKSFLLALKNDKFRDQNARKALYSNYSMQLEKSNFKSVEFPKSVVELKSTFYALRSFILHRASRTLDNSSLMTPLKNFISNEQLKNSPEFLELLTIIALKYNLDDATHKAFTKTINEISESNDNFSSDFFSIYDRLHTGKDLTILPEDEHNLGKLMVEVKDKQIINFFKTTNELHSKGFISVDSIENVRKYYETHQGMSLENEVLRSSVLSYITKFLRNLEPQFYLDYMETNRVIINYIGIFDNERFNQEVKTESMSYVKKALESFSDDKRGKDYQDIKKYMASTFVELGFLSEKDIVDMFKTKRKK